MDSGKFSWGDLIFILLCFGGIMFIALACVVLSIALGIFVVGL